MAVDGLVIGVVHGLAQSWRPVPEGDLCGKADQGFFSRTSILIETALIFGFYAARVPLHWTVRWAMVIGAFGNSSLYLLQYLLQSIFPEFDTPVPPEGRPTGRAIPRDLPLYLMGSISTTTMAQPGSSHPSLTYTDKCCAMYRLRMKIVPDQTGSAYINGD